MTPTRVPEAYSFNAPLGIEAMRSALDRAGLWTWRLNDSDTYGEYLSARPSDSHSRLRIFRLERDGHYLLDTLYSRQEGAPFLTREELDRMIREELLPAVRATDIQEAEAL